MRNLLILFFITWACCFISLAEAKYDKFNSDSKCQFKQDDLCIVVKFENGISRKNDSPFEIKFTEKNKAVLNKPELKLWMVMKNGHGHGSETLTIKASDKKFAVSNAWFMMMGQWSIVGSIKAERKLYNFSLPICVGRTASESHLGECK